MVDNVTVTQEFAPCPTCKQYSHSIGKDELAAAFNHFQSMYAHPLRGHPMGHWFDEKTRDAAQVLMAAARLSPAPEGADARESPWLVWSHEHNAFWAPERCGYTRHIDRAGRYSRQEAELICRSADYRANSGLGRLDDVPPEICFPAPEAALSRPPAEQVRMREAEYARGVEDAAKVAESAEPSLNIWQTLGDSMPGSAIVRHAIVDAIRALTPPPKGQNDHG